MTVAVLGVVLAQNGVEGQTAKPPAGPDESTRRAVSRVHEQNGRFTAAVGEFLQSLNGTFGDEGDRVWRSLRSMRVELTAWDESIRSLETSIAPSSGDTFERLNLGKAYLDRGRLDEALREFELAGGARSAEASLMQGITHQAAGRTAQARAAFQNAAALAPGNPPAALSLAQMLAGLDGDDQARTSIEAFLQLHRDRLQTQLPADADSLKRRTPMRFSTADTPVQWLERMFASEPVFGPAPYQDGLARLRAGRYEEAIASLEKAAAVDPLSAGAVAKGTGLAAVLDATRRAAEAQPADARRQFKLGQIYAALGGAAEARKAFESALRLQDTLSEAAVRLAATALREGNVQAAVEYLVPAVAREPGLVEARRLLGIAFQANGSYDESIAQFRAAAALKPADERLGALLAGALITAQRMTEAEEALKELVRATGGTGQARYQLGRFYQSQQKQVEAVKEFEAALAFQPIVGAEHLHRTIGAISADQLEMDRAIDAYRAAVARDPNNAESHRHLSVLYFNQNRDDDALLEIFVLLTIDPQSTEAYTGLGQIHLRNSRYVEAAAAARAALLADPRLPTARYTLATALIRLGRTEEGQAELERFRQLQAEALAHQHEQRELLALRQEASASLENGDHEKAVTLLRRTIQNDPYSGASHLNLGLGLLKARRYEEALEAFQRALQLKVDSPDLHYRLAEAYNALGRRDEGLREAQLARRMQEDQLRQMGARR